MYALCALVEKYGGGRGPPSPSPSPSVRSDSALPGWPRCVGPRPRAARRTSSRKHRCSMRHCASSASRARRAAATTARLRTAWACLPSSPSGWTCSVSRVCLLVPGPGACFWGLRLGRRSGEKGREVAPPCRTTVETFSFPG